MWRSVPSRGGSKLATSTVVPEALDHDDDDALAKTKPLRATGDHNDAAWIRKGYVVAAVALIALFLLSGFLTTHSTTLTTITTPTVLNYIRTFNMEPGTESSGLSGRPESLESEFTQVVVDDPDLEDSPTTEVEVPELLESGTESHPLGCNARDAKLKVFMYDLPPEFHYGMIAEEHMAPKVIWPGNVSALPRYPGGLYQQHSPEYWLISDVLTSDMPDRTSPCTAFRVRRWQDADVMLVPFFASLSYNKYSGRSIINTPGKKASKETLTLNQELQVNLLAFLKTQPAWRARAEAHVLVIHHPNSMVAMRAHFRNGNFVPIFVVADFGRYGDIGKDVVAPYKHIIPSFETDIASAESYASRPSLLFFQGMIVRKQGGVIRQQLFNLLRNEPDVVFATGETTSAGIRSATSGMRTSKFCLHLAGDTPSSNRLFDAVASHCVPLVVSDEIELPFEDVLDYSQFCLFVNSSDALRKGFVTNLLRGVSVEAWAQMHARLQEVHRHFQWQHPSELGDAVHMTWEAVVRKLPALTLARNKRRRYARSRAGLGQAT